MSWGSHVLWALLNSIWQSAVLAIVVFVVLRVVRGTTAAQRYLVWGSVLIAIALLPLLDLAVPAHTVSVPVPKTVEPVKLVAAPRADTAQVPSRATHLEQQESQPNPSFRFVLFLAQITNVAGTVVPVVVALGAGLLLLRLAVGYARLRGAKRCLRAYELSPDLTASLRASSRRPLMIGLSDTIGEPCAIGFSKPAISLPGTLVETLSEADLVKVLRHECAHVRRYDDYGHLAEQILRALLFFNPTMYVVVRALDIDREIACDDAVSSAESERVEFAKCLYEIARMRMQTHWVPTTGFARNRSALIHRIARLVDRNHKSSARIGVAGKVAALAVVIAALPLGYMQLSALAYAPEAPTPVHQTKAEKHTAMLPPVMKPKKMIAVAQATMTPEPTMTPDATMSPTATMTPQSTMKPKPVPKAMLKPKAQPQLAMVTPAAPPSPPSKSVAQDDFLSALSDAGFRNLSVDDLIRIHNSGVSADFVRSLNSQGLTPMSSAELVRLANSGVNATFLAGMRDAGYGKVQIEQLIRARDSGVDPEFASGIKRAGVSASIDDLIRLRDAGVDGMFIDHLRSSGIVSDVHRLSIEQLIKLRNSGI